MMNDKQRKCRIVNTLSTGANHEMFNATLLAMCMSIFDAVEEYCELSSWEGISTSPGFSFLYSGLFKGGRIHSKIRFCMLGDSILSNIQPFIYRHNKNSFFSIDHAYYFNETSKHKKRPNESLTIFKVEMMNTSKGYQR